MSGAAIAARALSCVGVPFRLHGRLKEEALDCVGLASEAVGAVIPGLLVPGAYSLRGAFDETVALFFRPLPFSCCLDGSAHEPGDIILAKPATRQAHLVIWIGDGFVHAHAGLRRTVFTPGLPDWPISGRWRYVGD